MNTRPYDLTTQRDMFDWIKARFPHLDDSNAAEMAEQLTDEFDIYQTEEDDES